EPLDDFAAGVLDLTEFGQGEIHGRRNTGKEPCIVTSVRSFREKLGEGPDLGLDKGTDVTFPTGLYDIVEICTPDLVDGAHPKSEDRHQKPFPASEVVLHSRVVAMPRGGRDISHRHPLEPVRGIELFGCLEESLT